jgi:hypothetical protein
MITHDFQRTSPCDVQASGAIELFFYGELDAAEQARVKQHLPACAHCREALDELGVIRDALASRPVVSMPASGDWSAFMARLERSVAMEPDRSPSMADARTDGRPVYMRYLAMAALLMLVTMSVLFVARSRPGVPTSSSPSAAVPPAGAPEPAAAPDDTGESAAVLAAASDEHFKRSKLVVLGLATMDPQRSNSRDWSYERSLASDLLSDTRLYRMAAEDRGMKTVAGVMRDLEVVLLETSLTDSTDPSALPQIQRLIQKRDLLEKMNVMTTAGL